MTRISLSAVILVLGLACPGVEAASGLATRDLNPVLQPIYLPGFFTLDSADGWRIDHSLYITNTHQDQSRAGESLIIDVENYRYDLSLGYRKGDWVFQASLPFFANQDGQLDGLIEDWHDFFGFPQGDRVDASQDQVNIQYDRDGVLEYAQTASSSGLADIALAFGYHPDGGIGYFVGIELPTGSESEFSGNEAVDLALWLLGERRIDDQLTFYGLFGVSFPGNGGALENLVAERIWIGQLGIDYRFGDRLVGIAQLDLHSSAIDDSRLKAFRESLQLQLGLGFERLFGQHRLDLFFSEDILVGSAPDISFGARLSQAF